MKYLDKKPFMTADIRGEYKNLTGKHPRKEGTMFGPTFEYTKWLEAQLSAKCIDLHLVLRDNKLTNY